MPRRLPEPPPLDEAAVVMAHRPIAPETRLLRLRSPHCAVHARPGSFLQIRVSEQADPLLRRPMSVGAVDPENGTIDVVYKVTGRGTTILSRAVAGDVLSVLGPLGHPYRLPDSGHVLLVGGGVGMPPVYFSACSLDADRVTMIQGARRADLLLYREELAEMGVAHVVATEDGSEGYKGFVTEPLDRILADRDGAHVEILACGPTPMLMAVARLAMRYEVPCQVSLEEHMACGIGICMGCAVARADADGPEYDLVCVDGPVFEASHVVTPGGEPAVR